MSTSLIENGLHLTFTFDFQTLWKSYMCKYISYSFYTYLQVSSFDNLSDDSDRVLLSNL